MKKANLGFSCRRTMACYYNNDTRLLYPQGHSFHVVLAAKEPYRSPPTLPVLSVYCEIQASKHNDARSLARSFRRAAARQSPIFNLQPILTGTSPCAIGLAAVFAVPMLHVWLPCSIPFLLLLFTCSSTQGSSLFTSCAPCPVVSSGDVLISGRTSASQTAPYEGLRRRYRLAVATRAIPLKSQSVWARPTTPAT